MPLFIVEREFAEALELNEEKLSAIDQYNAEHEIRWLTSFLSADKRKTYCLYESADIDRLRAHAADLGLPADVITPVEELVR